MNENDIRPDNLKKKIRKLSTIDLHNILLHKNDYIEVVCPACESNSNKFIFEKEGFNFVSCNECETVFVNPRPTADLIKKYYNTSHVIKFWNEEVYPKSEDIRRQKIFATRVQKVKELCSRHNAKTNNLLDVGAGFGTFCEEIIKLKLFKNVLAVEPSHTMALTCQKKGIEVIKKTIEDVLLDPVDVITSFELIEHLFCPKQFINACSKNLKTNGLFFITTPNIKGFDLLTLQKVSNNICGPGHLNYFHPQSLQFLLKKCGFKVIEILTPGKLDAELVRKKVLSNEIDISEQPFLKLILIEQWSLVGEKFQAFLANNLLSSHMWMVAQKM